MHMFLVDRKVAEKQKRPEVPTRGRGCSYVTGGCMPPLPNTFISLKKFKSSASQTNSGPYLVTSL